MSDQWKEAAKAAEEELATMLTSERLKDIATTEVRLALMRFGDVLVNQAVARLLPGLEQLEKALGEHCGFAAQELCSDECERRKDIEALISGEPIQKYLDGADVPKP